MMKNEIHAPHSWQDAEYAPENFCGGVGDSGLQASVVPGQEFYDDGNGIMVDQNQSDPADERMREVAFDRNTSREAAFTAMRERIEAQMQKEKADDQAENLPVRWADRAMFKAEPIDADDGPKVYLLWMTPDPLGAIAAACKMYKGEVVRDLATVTDDERLEYFQQVQKTKLKAPFEFVKFHFMIEGVTRAFTHQMVRQRTAVYAQESLRFAVIGEEGGGIPVRTPPSLSGLPEDDPERRDWEDANAMIGNVYQRLVSNGVPAEDARGLLPHNVLTRLHYSTDLRALLDHAGNRLCTQAQFEWRLVFAKIVESIRDAENHDAGPVDIVGSPGYVKMARELTSLFKPVCYQTGKCEFKANFDRACSIRWRVDKNEAAGRPPAEWDKPGGYPHPAHQSHIPAIKPGEWLLDPGAARKQ